MSMFKVCALSLLFFGLPMQYKMVKTKVNESITLMLPEEFYPMTPEDIARRYPSVRSPLGAYTIPSLMADFSVNISATRWRASDIDMAKNFFRAGVYNLFDKVTMIREEVQTVNGKQFIVFEFDSRINGDPSSLEARQPVRRYNYVQYLLINGKTIVFSFNCHARIKEQWQQAVAEIMTSIKVKNNI